MSPPADEIRNRFLWVPFDFKPKVSCALKLPSIENVSSCDDSGTSNSCIVKDCVGQQRCLEEPVLGTMLSKKGLECRSLVSETARKNRV